MNNTEFGIEIQRTRHERVFKFITWILIFIFSFNQTGFTGDKLFYQYKSSDVGSLLPGESEQDQSNRMAPPFLRITQRKHEEIIRTKNQIEEEMILLPDKSFRDKRDKAEEALPLKKKRSAGDTPLAPEEKRIEYTLTDFDEEGNPQQISVYTYGKIGRAHV